MNDKFQVLAIHDFSTVYIDAGLQNIQVGQYIAIIDKEGDILRTKEGQPIGYSEAIKAVLEVESVSEKTSKCISLPQDTQYDILHKYEKLKEQSRLNASPRYGTLYDQLNGKEIFEQDPVIILY